MLETTFLTLPYTRSDQYLGLVHVVVQQKPTQHCKAIILQLKFFLNLLTSAILAPFKAFIIESRIA